MPDSVGFTHITEAAAPGIAGFAATFLSILFVLNLLLGTFNLLPVPPLDGNTAITVFMSDRAALRFVSWTRSQGFGMAGIAAGLGALRSNFRLHLSRSSRGTLSRLPLGMIDAPAAPRRSAPNSFSM